jgi:hypothetical protein
MSPQLPMPDTLSSAQKGHFLKDAASQNIAILFPDTSPRGAGIEGEDDDWDFGTGLFRNRTLLQGCLLVISSKVLGSI